jgi:lysozyme
MSLKQQAVTLVSAVSAACLTMIAGYEGKSNVAYPDIAYGWDLPTICYGHTGSDVKQGQRLTDAQCWALLRKDADAHTGYVLGLVSVPLSQGELDAYTSFVFNVGPTNFKTSTLRSRLNAGDRWGACMQLLRWDQAKGVRYKGLVDRRHAEYNVCVSELPIKENRSGNL